MKLTVHKSCSCAGCKRGKRSAAGKFKQNLEERKLRRGVKRDLADIVKGGDQDADVTVRVNNDYKD